MIILLYMLLVLILEDLLVMGIIMSSTAINMVGHRSHDYSLFLSSVAKGIPSPPITGNVDTTI